MLYGSRLFEHVELPPTEFLSPSTIADEVQDLVNRHGLVLVKPLFKGSVGKNGKSGLIGKARDRRGRCGR